MKTKQLFFLMALCLLISFAQAQNNLGINTTTPHASAALDVTSTTQGMLVPRMTQSQRDAIASPATGLMIFQTDNTAGFYYYSGTAWTVVGQSGTSPVMPGGMLQRQFPQNGAQYYFSPYSPNIGSNLSPTLAFYVPANTTISLTIYSFDDEPLQFQLFKVTPGSGTSFTVSGSALATATVPVWSSGAATSAELTYSAIAGETYTFLMTKSGGGAVTTSSYNYTYFKTK